MPPRATGTLDPYTHADGVTVTFRARVRAYGARHRVVFGTNRVGWNLQRAENELERIQDQIARGIWKPPEREAPPEPRAADVVRPDETFHVYASRWYADKKLELTDKGKTDYEWRLGHLLRHLATVEVRAITTRTVDRYRAALLRENEALEAAHAAAKAAPPLSAAQRRLLDALASGPRRVTGADRRTARALHEREVVTPRADRTYELSAAGVAAAAAPRRPRRKPLGPRAINMTLDLLADILAAAVEDELLDANPARGKKRRMKNENRARGALEPDMVVELVEEARRWERAAGALQRYGIATFFEMLALAGPRITELTETRRTRLDIHGARVVLGKKTAAGTDREVELTAYLLDDLRAHLAATPPELRAHKTLPLFPSGTGGELSASNLRNRALADVVQAVNARRQADGDLLLPDPVTPHTFRRTFATLALTAGRDPRLVMGWLGHSDARFTLSVYAQVMRRQRIDYDLVWQLMRFQDEPEEWQGARRGALSSAFGPLIGPPSPENEEQAPPERSR